MWLLLITFFSLLSSSSPFSKRRNSGLKEFKNVPMVLNLESNRSDTPIRVKLTLPSPMGNLELLGLKVGAWDWQPCLWEAFLPKW